MVVLRGKRRLPSSLETVTWEHGGEGKGEGARGWCGFWLTLQGERRRTEENRHAGTTWPWEARGGGKALCRGREGRGEEGASCWDEQPTSGATCRTNCCTACSYRRKVEILVSPSLAARHVVVLVGLACHAIVRSPCATYSLTPSPPPSSSSAATDSWNFTAQNLILRLSRSSLSSS